jgi:hypothetical protein
MSGAPFGGGLAGAAGVSLLLLAIGAGCASPPRADGGSESAVLYVANAGDGTVTRLDPASGRAAGPPVPAGPAPGQLVPGSGGSLLVLSLEPGRRHPLTLVRRVGGRWIARAVPLEPAARAFLLAGDGGPEAVAAYVVPSAPGAVAGRACRLAVVRLPLGTVAGASDVCAPSEAITALALARQPGDGPAGSTAYVGVWRAGAGGRLLAVDGRTGGVRRVLPLAGAPVRLAVAPAPDGLGWRLYTVEALPGSANERLDRDDLAYAVDDRWYLHVLDLDTLTPLVAWPLDGPARGLAVAPDGGWAYFLSGGSLSGSLRAVDLSTGVASRLASLPAPGGDLVVTEERVYVTNPPGRELWAVDRRRGGPVRRLPVGRGPVGLTLGAAA